MLDDHEPRVTILDVLRIPAALGVGALILVATQLLMTQLLMTDDPPMQALLAHAVIAVLSLIVILILTRGYVGDYGLRLELPTRPWANLGFAAGIGVLSVVVDSVLGGHGIPLMQSLNLWQSVVIALLLAPIAQELLLRGVMQGLLVPLEPVRFTMFDRGVSLPVVVSALAYGGLHFPLVLMDVEMVTVWVTVGFAIALGFQAAQLRESTGSLVGPVLVHISFAAGGGLGSIILDAIV